MPARPRNMLTQRTLALLAQLRMLTQRALSRSTLVRAAAHAHAARTLTQRFNGARYLRSRCVLSVLPARPLMADTRTLPSNARPSRTSIEHLVLKQTGLAR
jgi:hypothetical protein